MASMGWMTRERLVDALIAAAFVLMVFAEATFGDGVRWPVAYVLVAACAMSSLAWRRQIPLLSCALVAIANFGLDSVDQFSPFLAMVLVMFTVGSETEQLRSYLGLAIMLVPFTVLLSWEGLEPSDVGAGLVFIVGPWVVGRANRQRAARAEQAIDRAAQLERERELQDAVVASEERTRIARELHDIVAHSISMVTVQTQAVRRRLGSDHPREVADLAGVESAARAAMVEMRRLFGVLRADGEGVSLAPQPGLRELDDLIEQLRSAGMEVEMASSGVPRELPAGLDLTAYRIIQEASTNAVRHSEATHLRVAVAYTAKTLEICVEDNGLGMDEPGRPGQNHGHGLVGLRERVALYGGTVDLVSAPGKGVRLTATLPLEAK